MSLCKFVCVFMFGVCAVTAQDYEELLAELDCATDRAVIHRLKAQTASLAMDRLEQESCSKTEQKKLKSLVLAHCADVQLGTMDLWYGDSVVSYGRLILLDGDWKEARSVLMSQAEVLENIEKNLAANELPVSSISPLAGCRYVLGETYRFEYEQTEELKSAVEALKHFYNVYIKYGDSVWGIRAQQKTEDVTSVVESKGRRVRVELGEHRGTFIKAKFSMGARLTAEERYEEALESYLDALNLYPESSKSASALRNIGICQLSLGQGDETLATVDYLCERFAADTNAPSAVLAIGRQYIEAGLEPVGEQVFKSYLTAFPEDDRRSDILSYFAWKAYKAELWQEALGWFVKLEQALRVQGDQGEELERVVYIQAVRSEELDALDAFMEEFGTSGQVPSALGKKAEVLLVSGRFDDAFETLELLGATFPEAPAARSALSGLIVAAVDAERFDIADRVLDRMLEDRESYGLEVYLSTGNGLLSAKQFTLAQKAFAAIPTDGERAFVEGALFGRCRALFGCGDFEDVVEAVEDLLQVFPDCGRFYALRLMQARALVELDRRDEAVVCYAEVLAAQADCAIRFEMAEILPAAEGRLAAYQRIVLLGDPADDSEWIARSIVASLPLCLELGKYQLAVENCEQFESLFPLHDERASVAVFRKEAADALAF